MEFDLLSFKLNLEKTFDTLEINKYCLYCVILSNVFLSIKIQKYSRMITNLVIKFVLAKIVIWSFIC